MTPQPPPPDCLDAPAATNLPTDEKAALLVDPSDGNKIFPPTFPEPQVDPEVITDLANDIRSSGEAISDTGADIKSSWGGLTSCYEAPHQEELYEVLDPVASDGTRVMYGMNRISNALEDFAETVESIQKRWDTLREDANTFRDRIASEGDEWRDAEGFKGVFGIGESEAVEENRALVRRGVTLIDEYEEAERDCANRINSNVENRTRFESMPSDNENLDDDVFYHGHEGDLSNLITEWGVETTTNEHWWVDAGAAVWDFGVDAIEGTGAMLGLHSSQGWLNMSWGDALFQYHEDNIQSALGLVGLYDSKSNSYGWAGWDSVGEEWKEMAHSVVPWREWDERPGYVIGTALLNIGGTVGGAVLTATGVGAPVGLALMAWRGMAILDGMSVGRGGSGGGSGGVDLDIDLPHTSLFGGPDAPVVRVNSDTFNTNNLSPDQLADMRRSLNQIQDLHSGNNGSGGGGGNSGGGTGTRPTQSSEGTENSRPTKPTRPATDDNTTPTDTSRTNRDNDSDTTDPDTVETSNRWGTDTEESANTTRDTPAEPQKQDTPDRRTTQDQGSNTDQGNTSGTDRQDRPHDHDTDQGTPQTRTDQDGQNPTTGNRQDSNSPTHSRRDPTTEQLSRSDRLLNQVNSMFSPEDRARFRATENTELAMQSGNRALGDPSSSPLKHTQVAEKFGLDGQMNSTFSDMRATASQHPNVPWEAGPGNGRPNTSPETGPHTDKTLAEVGASPKADTTGANRTPDSGQDQNVRLDDSSGRKSDGDQAGERAKLKEADTNQAGAQALTSAGAARAAMGSGGKGPNAPTRGDTSSSRNSPTSGGDKKTPSTNTNRSNESSNGQGSRKDSGSGKDSTRRDSGQSGTRKDSGNDSTRRDGSKQDTGSRKGDDSGSRKRDDGGSRKRDDGPSSRSDSRDSTPSGRRDNGNQPDSGPRRDGDSQKDSGPRKDNDNGGDTPNSDLGDNSKESKSSDHAKQLGDQQGKRREWLAQEDIEGPARGKILRDPNPRHNFSSIKHGRVAEKNSIILPGVLELVRQDISHIASGKANFDRKNQTYEISERKYAIEPSGTVFPVSGPGIVNIDRNSYTALQMLQKAGGETEGVRKALEMNPRFSENPNSVQIALDLYRRYS